MENIDWAVVRLQTPFRMDKWIQIKTEPEYLELWAGVKCQFYQGTIIAFLCKDSQTALMVKMLEGTF